MEYVDALINTFLVLGMILTFMLFFGIPALSMEIYRAKTQAIFIGVGELLNTFAFAFIVATVIWRGGQGLFN